MAKILTQKNSGTLCIVSSKRSSGNFAFLHRHRLIKRFPNIPAYFRILLTFPMPVGP